MREVLTISLNGNAYQVEQGGYEALQIYLETAQTKLSADPDKAEILADLEQAIAEKCSRYLGPHKSVVTTEEMQQVLTEMGPVDGEPGPAGAQGPSGPAGASGGPAPAAETVRRLYQIREGAMISGVCMGIAAYFNIDVAIVRLVFIGLAVLSGGLWVLAYIVMMLVIPYASTSEEHAAAHGLPFNAQNLIDAFKRQQASFTTGARWQRQWRRQLRRDARAWRREFRRGRRQMRDHTRWWGPPLEPGEAGYGAHVLMGLIMPLAGLLNAVIVIAFLLSIVQLVTRGEIFGWEPPPAMPLWADIVVLCILLSVLTEPLRATRRAYYLYGPGANAWFALWGTLVWLAFMGVLFWVACLHWPDLRRLLEEIGEAIRSHRTHSGEQILLGLRSLLPPVS